MSDEGCSMLLTGFIIYTHPLLTGQYLAYMYHNVHEDIYNVRVQYSTNMYVGKDKFLLTGSPENMANYYTHVHVWAHSVKSNFTKNTVYVSPLAASHHISTGMY